MVSHSSVADKHARRTKADVFYKFCGPVLHYMSLPATPTPFNSGATEAVFERQVTHVQDSSQLARSGSESKDGEAKVASTSQTEVEGEQFGDAGLSVVSLTVNPTPSLLQSF